MKKVDAVIAFFAAIVILFGILQAVYITLTKGYVYELTQDVSEVTQERQRLVAQLERQQEAVRPAVAVAAEVQETPVFKPLDVPLDEDLQRHAWQLCRQNDLPFSVVMAIAWHESRFQLDAVGRNTNGIYDSGLMQINDINREWLAEDHGLDVNDPYDNIEAGIIILSRFWHKYPSEQALSAYAWGETGMLEAGEVAPSAYRVLKLAAQYESEVTKCYEN